MGLEHIVYTFEHSVPTYDFVAKLTLTALVLGAGFKGGEVTPIFFVGATLGNTLSKVIQRYPNIILACSYTDAQLEHMFEKNRFRSGDFPFANDPRYDPLTNPYPETPTFPIIGPSWGHLGFNNLLSNRDTSDTLRWVPLMAEYTGSAQSLNILIGARNYFNLPKTSLVKEEANYGLYTSNQSLLLKLPITQNVVFYQMAIEALRAYYNYENVRIVKDDKNISLRDKENKEIHQIPLNKKQFVEINWLTPWYKEEFSKKISLSKYIEKYKQKKENEKDPFWDSFQKALVIIGPTEDTLDDFISTPLDKHPTPRINALGNLIQTIYSGKYIYRLPNIVDIIVLYGLSFLFGLCGFYSGRYSLGVKIVPVGIIGGIIVLCYFLFEYFNFALNVSAPLISATTVFIFSLFLSVLEERKKRNYLKGLFGNYVSPTVVESMIESNQEPQLGGIQAEISAMFCDIQQFSTFSELMTPHALVELMNDYFTDMTQTLVQAGGTLDKYIGDAMVAMFGAPLPEETHAWIACKTALALQKTQKQLQQKWMRQYPNLPKIIYSMNTRVGINTGLAIIGNMGSKQRFSYTMMGDTVNLAARTEKSAADYGVLSLVTEETKNSCEQHSDQIVFRFINKTMVRGRQKAVSLFEIIGFRTETIRTR